jgi:glutamine synthetase
MLSVDKLQTLHDSGEIDTVIVGFTDHYGRLMGKRFDSGFFLDEGVSSGTHACDYLLTVDVDMEPVPGYTFASWQMGYGDFHLVPDMATLRLASWLPRTALVLCDLADTDTHEPVSVGPRSILSRQVTKAAGMGFEVAAASELEFFIFKDSYRKAKKKRYAGLKPAGLYPEDYDLFSGGRVESFVGAARRHLRDSGVPVETRRANGVWDSTNSTCVTPTFSPWPIATPCSSTASRELPKIKTSASASWQSPTQKLRATAVTST